VFLRFKVNPAAATLTACNVLFFAEPQTQRGGQNAILVYITHILQLQHPLTSAPRTPETITVFAVLRWGDFYTASKKEVVWVV